MGRTGGRPRFHAVLLAGGSGRRFWPQSRAKRPKQFLPLGGREPLLVQTWKRLRRLAPAERIWVVAPRPLLRPVRKLLPDLGRGRLVVEPTPRDTAPAVTLGTLRAARSDPDAIVGVFPTDHVIRDEQAFVETLRLAIDEARRGRLVCLGIRPDRPATGFGYLACAGRPVAGSPLKVRRFVEKPDVVRARRFLRSGTYLWNGGMFVWSASRYRDEVGRVAPALLSGVEKHLGGGKTAWRRVPRISVDYAVMERAREVSVLPLDAGWDDLGSWDAAARLREADGREEKESILLDSPGSVVFGEKRTVALVDAPGLVVVDTPDALLVVSRTSAERVKEVVERLERTRREDLL